jgi:hypothetical protein
MHFEDEEAKNVRLTGSTRDASSSAIHAVFLKGVVWRQIPFNYP